jgi:hypothetical protein
VAEGRRTVTLNRIRTWTSPTRFLIDANIIDRFLEMPDLIDKIQQAAKRGSLTIIETHILRDQLEATKDEQRRARLLAVYEALPKTPVATSAFILDASRLDVATPGDESMSASIGRLKPSRDLGGLKDALLAVTAAGKADVLVTEDTRLKRKIGGTSISAWGFDQFYEFIKTAIR